jgi:preprotein translocase subunit SecA
MFKNLTRVVGGDPVRRQLARYTEQIEQINALESEVHALSDTALRAKTDSFRQRLEQGETLDDLLVEAFAVVREVGVRTIGMRHFDVQLMGGIILHEGKIAEMRTGEGKTLVATLPLYLNALEGKGAHLVTVNDYLARRDARWMGPIYRFLGLEVGILQEAARTEHGRKAFVYDPEKESAQEDAHQLRMVDRRSAYASEITYGTNNEFGFDYLRDNMAIVLEDRSQRGHHYAILDEVDNILIDEARTPLIISGPSQEDPQLYEQTARMVSQLRPEDYEVNERNRTISLTEAGELHIGQLLGAPLRDVDRPEDISPEQARLLGHLEQALRAEHLFKRNKHYVVQGGRVIIVDEFTGRMMAGRRWSDGLHQAVEAKEGVKVREENVTYATITLQNYFRMYKKLAGMTGTAVTESEEFSKIYSVDVLPLPTNLEFIASRPDTDLVEVEYRENGSKFSYFSRASAGTDQPAFWRRKDYPDLVYRTEEAKLRAVSREILVRHVRGQPLLVGTTSVEMSERLSSRLRAESLQRLALSSLLRDVYMERHNIEDPATRVEALLPLNDPLEQLQLSVMRPIAKELDIQLNATRPENINALLPILGLDPEDAPRLEQALEGGIRHAVLNAKKHDEESRIIAGAGALGAVTIATNMAGRGVDIKLGGEVAEEVLGIVNRVLRRAGIEDPETLTMEEKLAALDSMDRDAYGIYESEVELFRQFIREEKRVKDVGGLHVIGSERHEARRIDNQLRGRAARQGDPGSSQFFLSLGDELMRLFGGYQVSSLMERLNIDDAVPIAHSIVNKTIEQAQTRVEGANFDTRKHLLEYDDVLNKQREAFYGLRNRVFVKDDLSADIRDMESTEVESHVAAALADAEGPWRLLAWLEETQPTLNLEGDAPYPSYMLRLLADSLGETASPSELKHNLLQLAERSMAAQNDHLRRAAEELLERSLERLDDQVKLRAEEAETAVEGLVLQAEEQGVAVDPRQLVQALERIAGLRIQLDDAALEQLGQDPSRLQRMLPQLVEGSLSLRVWAGVVQAIERRLGDTLGLESTLQTPVDWQQAEGRLLAALDRVLETRRQETLKDLERDLDGWLGQMEPTDPAGRVRVLVRMSYGQRSFFDRRTHQKRSAVVARLVYPYYAAELLPTDDAEGLTEEILDHLDGAHAALYLALGAPEQKRILQTPPEARSDEQLELLRLSAVAANDLASEAADGPGSETAQAAALGRILASRSYRRLILSVGDRQWVEYLTQMEALRTSIGLEAYGQRDPLVQYKSRASDMFRQLMHDIRAGVVSRVFRVQPSGPPRAMAQAEAAPSVAVAPPAGSPAAAAPEPVKRSKRKRRRH